MFTRSRTFKEFSTTGAHAAPRRRVLYLVLLLALCMQPAVQTTPAHAAPPADEVSVDLVILTKKEKLCVGSVVEYVAAVITTTASTGGNGAPSLEGIRIEASSNDSSIMQPASTNRFYYHTTGFGSTDGAQPHTAGFLFTAKKVGKTSIDFEALVGGKYRSKKVPVQVVNCKFRVSTISRWSGSSPYGSMRMVAITSRPVLLEFPDADYGVNASTNVAWVETTIVPKYAETNNLRFGKLDIEAWITDQGELEVTAKLQPVTFNQTICAPIVGCGGGSVTSYPDKLIVSVSADYGGTRTRTTGIEDEGGTMYGPTTVYVVPVKK